MSQLTPCPECQRHVRKTEARCPFCASALSLSHLPDHVLPRKRLGRAATFAFGATVAGATALGACDDPVTVAPPYGIPPGGSSFAGSAVYGAPPSGSSSGGNANSYSGAGTAVYGAPAAGTGGVEPGGNGGTSGNGGASGDGGAAGDGGATDGGAGGVNQGEGGATIYGGPPAGVGGV